MTTETLARLKAGGLVVHAPHPTLGQHGFLCEIEAVLTGVHVGSLDPALVTCPTCLEWMHA